MKQEYIISKIKIILLWVAVPFAAVLAQGIVRILFDIFNAPGWFLTPETLDEISQGTVTKQHFWAAIYVTLRETMTVGAALWAATIVAPTKKQGVFIVLATVWILMYIFSGALMLIVEHTFGEWLIYSASAIGTVIAVITTYFGIKEEGKFE